MTTFEEVQDEFLYNILDGQRVDCPCCGRTTKLYRRKLNAGMARRLIGLYQEHGREWFYVESSTEREEAKLRFWHLFEEDDDRHGWWRVTSLGERFIHGKVEVISHAEVVAGRCIALVGEPISLEGALGQPFNLEDLYTESR